MIIGNIFAAEISIIPIKKPISNDKLQITSILQGILQPKPKPTKKKENTQKIKK